MLTGSYASNLYGRVRSTMDADLVVLLAAGQMLKLVRELDADFYLDSRSLAEVSEAGREFNAIHKSSGLRVDFFLLGAEAFDRAAFRRRKRKRIFGRSVPVISAEDLILAKLRWAKQGGSGRQIEDAAGVFEAQRGRLDLPYLRRWAGVLGIAGLLDRLRPKE